MASTRSFSTPTLSINSRASCSPRSTPTTPLSEYEFDFGLLGEVSEQSYILVTGGLGYIGSHTALELLKAGHNVIVIDNLSNSYSVVLDRIKHLVNEHYSKIGKSIPSLVFHEIDYRDTSLLRAVLDRYPFNLGRTRIITPSIDQKSRVYYILQHTKQSPKAFVSPSLITRITLLASSASSRYCASTALRHWFSVLLLQSMES